MSYGNIFGALSMYPAIDNWVATLNKNLDGVARPGFRATRTTFEGAPGFFAGLQDTGRPGLTAQTSLNPTTELDMAQGVLQPTGKMTDYAIVGEGFFMLEDDAGELYYTRFGEFSVSDTGFLMVPEGLKVVTQSRLIELGLMQPLALTTGNAARLINHGLAGWQRPENTDGFAAWFPYFSGTVYDEAGMNYREQLITMRKTFDLGPGPIDVDASNSFLEIVSNDWTHLYVNGQWVSKQHAIAVGSVFGSHNPSPAVDGPTAGGQFGQKTRYDISSFLRPGLNQIAVYSSEVRDSEGVSISGQIAGLTVTTDHSLPVSEQWLVRIISGNTAGMDDTKPEPFPDDARLDYVLERQVSDLVIARFAVPSKLEYSKYGQHILKATVDAGPPNYEFSAKDERAKVRRGFLEAANSTVKAETSELALAQKMYDALTAFMQLQLQSMERTLNIIK